MQKEMSMRAERRPTNAPLSEAERKVRVELAACYRLAQREGWDELIYNHISARVPGAEHHFLINPFGLAFEEVTASNLVKVDLDGTIIGESATPINAAGFTIHSAVHAAKPDIGCVIHLHTEAGMAISMLEKGLAPLSQTAMFFHGRIGFHDYEGVALNLEERERLVRDLGDNAIVILRNHGTLVACPTIGQAFVTMFLLEKAARAQLKAMATGARLNEAPSSAVEITSRFGRSGKGGSEHAWAAMMRRLDRIDPSYKN
ncbi:MAG TPA: class II aldolase/adducin family protein [Stellaceae bacterium]|nr:class II aldolase/adducin family protein [Stellaceae bacterium]